MLGDEVTIDHIWLVGQIPAQGNTSHWLIARREDPGNLNVFPVRRGN
ncbi:hypothetical protein [Cereibacter sphaeroides]|nr:hypothetical protein [Cereibacter sphaeroides]